MRNAGRHLRPLGIADILDETADLYRNNFALLIGIAAICYVPYSLISESLTRHLSNPVSNPGPRPEAWQAMSALGPLFVFMFFFLAVVMPIVTGALTFAVSERYLGRPTTIGHCYRRVLRADVFFPFLGALALKYGALAMLYVLTVAAVFFLGAIVGVAGGALGFLFIVPLLIAMVIALVYAALRLIFVEPSFIVESQGASGSLGRSWRLMGGSVGKALGIIFIVGLVIMLISAILTGPTQAIIMIKTSQGAPISPAVYIINSVLATLVNVLTVPIYSIVVILLYYDVRIRKEGFDLELLAKELDERITVEDSRGISSLPQEQLRPPEDVDRQ